MAFVFTGENFQNEAVNSEKLTVVDFYADWCGPCKMMAPILENLAEEMQEQAKIGKINVDHAPEVARNYGVMNIPTILFLKGGSVVEKIVGVVPRETLVEKIIAHAHK
ncbi:MAG: thioredoxin [bacterium]|nr:thioredoxin [bacterium]